MTKCAFYGSLRRGGYNAANEDKDMLYLKTTTIGGYKMYSLGAYPACVVSDNNKDVITIELYDLSDDNFRWIDNMEKGAGYHTTIIEVDGEKYLMYLHDVDSWKDREDRLVTTGNWIEYESKYIRNDRTLGAES